jgi:hypothetical protein
MESDAKPRGVKWILILMPAWFIISGALGLWMYFSKEKEKQAQPTRVGGFLVSQKSMADDFRKLCDVIGPRDLRSAPEGLVRAAAMIEGGMGLSNAGFEVRKYEGIADAEKVPPFLHIRLAGSEDSTKRRTWVLVPYDAPAITLAPRGAVAASALTVAMASAQSMSQQRFDRPPNFLFVPSLQGSPEDRAATLQRLQTIIGEPSSVEYLICVGNMLHLGKLQLLGSRSISSGFFAVDSKDANLQASAESFPPEVAYLTDLEQRKYQVMFLRTSPQATMAIDFEDRMNPPPAIFAQHTESIRRLLQGLCMEQKK